jgi:aryl-alcohol dehydrogenase-like predicted oxidoreductase
MLGGNVFGWTADEKTSFAILDRAAEAGLNFIDTADVYSRWVPGHRGGESETIIGNWVLRHGKRDEVILATKVGIEMPNGKGLSRSHILRSAEDSLKRLRTDYIDLYQSHEDDPQTPLEETLEAYSRLIQDGKVRVIGASNYGADRLRQALETSRNNNLPVYQSLQPLYNLYDRADYEANLASVAQEFNLGVVPYFSLAAGFLTGKYRSEADLANKPRAPRVKTYLNERGQRILRSLDEVAKATESTPAQIALAWLMAQPTITAPIASATSIPQLGELIDATELKLPKEAFDQLTEASSASQSAGA